MKKKILKIVVCAALLLVILFAPIPGSAYRDGGTREYRALTYKIVDWNRITADSVYEATKLYWFPDNFKSIDELWDRELQNVTNQFVATVQKIENTSVLVKPVDGEEEQRTAPLIRINTAQLGDIGAEVGSDVEIWYTGGIMESFPAQINAVKWMISTDLSHRNYDGQWLDMETAQPCEFDLFSDLVITQIYADCFFARPVIPMPYEIKLNGRLSNAWCVGDQVSITYENACYDERSGRIEADFLTVVPSDFELEPGVCYKPVIYLYPENEMEVSVELVLDGRLTCTYPSYDGGWQVTAAPDGTLTDANGQSYNYLYWEGETNARWDMPRGFCVKGEDTAVFLEESLEKLGLNRREANEFIVYWLPLMEPNAYNIISFQTDVYTDAAQLNICPAPDTVIRVFMTWQGADTYIAMEPQDLAAPDRSGFTVVEWGGTAVSGSD